MRSATTRSLRSACGREWLLAWLVCGGLAHAQADAGATDAGASAPAAGVTIDGGATLDAAGIDANAPEDGAASTAADLVAAEPVDPVAAGEQLVASNTAAFGRKSLETAEAYVDLADAQRQAKDYERAAENYLAAVEVYRAIDGPFTPLAIGPLTSLGDNYHEADDHTNAVAAYSEARTVSRRAYGLHNTEQIELLDRLSRSLLDLNQLGEAEAQQVEALRLVQRTNPPDSDAVLEGIYKYAEWLGDRQMFQLQRDQYTRALRIIRETYGERDLRQVRPLLGIGTTYREERNPASMGISSLQEALALLLEQPERDPVAVATALRDLGDWNVAFGKTGYDGTEYQQAWLTLGSAPNGERLRREWFTGANYVLYEPISPRGLSLDPDALMGHVTVAFDVDTAGNSSNVRLIDSEPVGLKDEAVLRHIRRSRFRPVIENGEVVRGVGLAVQVKFSYLPEGAAADDED